LSQYRPAVAAHWNSLYDRRDPSSLPWELSKPSAEVDRWIKSTAPASKVLDLGCGTGLNTLAFAAAGHMAVGIDISQSAIVHAKQRAAGSGWPVYYCVADILALPISSSFDLVYDYSVFHHIPPRNWHLYKEALLQVTAYGSRYALVTYLQEQQAGHEPNVIIGDYGNMMYEPSSEAIATLLRPDFYLASSSPARLGSRRNHRAQHLQFVRV